MSDFWKGVGVWVCAVVTVVILFNWVGTAWKGYKNHQGVLMIGCQSNGYTWGDCFNVIYGDQRDFSK